LKRNQKLSSAIVAVLSVHSAAAHAQAQTSTGGASSSEGIQEVVVTAQRRSESIQDVPITVQALTGETLKQLNVQIFDQFIATLPNVTQQTTGPGQGEIYIRGISVASSVGALPAVAVYLDEQSGQLPGRNLDVYAADLERIEVLEGPQGTLFGGGALSGVLRYITNKPKLNVTEGNFEAGYGVTAHGAPNSSVVAVINLPVVEDKFALRGVFYNDRQGGYIDNLPSTFTRLPTDEGVQYTNNGVLPKNSVVINNYNIVRNDINPVSYTGLRVHALWKIDANWDALLTQSYQNMDSNGVFYQMPYGSEGTTFSPTGLPIGKYPLPRLSVTLFNPSWNDDKFENTSLVVNGNVNDFKMVYAGAYLVRNVEQRQDYTNYARGVFGFYYQCAGYSKTDASKGKCYTPSAVIKDYTRNTHQSHEFRISSPDDRRFRALLGVYWEDYYILGQTHWTYSTVPICSPTGLNVDCFLPIKPWPGSVGMTLTPPIGFINDIERRYKQLAEFASVDFDIVPKVLTLTGGIRHFKYDENESGGDVGSFYCKQFAPTNYFGFCKAPYGTDFTGPAAYHTVAKGSRGRVNLTWKVTPDIMLYTTWSQGFRAGTFNRSTGCHLPGPDGFDQFCLPAFTVPDNVTNTEFGWKTVLWNRRIQFNAAVYQMDWTNAQVGFFDPQGGFGNLAFLTNGPSYRVRGFEPSLLARVTEGLTVQMTAAWNSSSQTNSPYLINNNPKSAGYGKPITSIPNPYGPLGSPTTYSPPFKFFGRIRYDWYLGNYNVYVQASGSHQAHMLTATGYVVGYDIPAFSTYAAAAGVSKGDWAVQIYGQNLTDTNASVSTDAGQFVEAQVPVRPRVLGIKVSYGFQEK
jgi:outer membrane receptor protein involved in Fe transport